MFGLFAKFCGFARGGCFHDSAAGFSFRPDRSAWRLAIAALNAPQKTQQNEKANSLLDVGRFLLAAMRIHCLDDSAKWRGEASGSHEAGIAFRMGLSGESAIRFNYAFLQNAGCLDG